MILTEIYRHTVDGRPVWKLRALGQGWADGLAASPAPTASTSPNRRESWLSRACR
jgi:hypothetical protein